MTFDVVSRKIYYLQQLLSDLALYQNASLAEVVNEHYKIERILELLIVTGTDLLTYLLAERGVVAKTDQDSFRLAAGHEIITMELAFRLQNDAGMKNVLLCLYEEIDCELLHQSLKPALQDFQQLVRELYPLVKNGN